MRLPTRVAGIILDGNRILLIHRKKEGREYWVFPGGGLEDTDKSNEEGLLREIQEETSVQVTVTKLIYTHDYTNNKGVYFLCKYISGQPVLGESVEKRKMSEDNTNSYKPVWVDLSVISNMLLYPLEIRDWLIEDIKNNFANTPRTQRVETKDSRKV